MKKIVLRIVVTALILAIVGIAVWLLFFPPNSNKNVFDELTAVQTVNEISLKDSIDKIIKNNNVQPVDVNAGKTEEKDRVKYIYNLDGLKNSSNANVALSESLKAQYIKISYFRTYLFGGFTNNENNPFKVIVEKTFEGNSVIDYNKNLQRIYNNIDYVFEYYYSYSQLVTGTTNKANDAVKSKISAYVSAINSFNVKVNEIVKLQSEIPTVGNETVVNELYENYFQIYKCYSNIIKTYNDLTMELKDYVIKFAFNGERVYDADTVAYDFILATTNEFSKYQIVPEEMHLYVEEYDGNVDGKIEKVKNKNFDYLNYAFTATLCNDLRIKMNAATANASNMTLLNNFIQDYSDLINYKGTNFEQTNAIIGSKNIFTLKLVEKVEIAKNAESELIKNNYVLDDKEKISNVCKYAFIYVI